MVATPKCPEPPQYKSRVLKRTALITAGAYAAWFSVYLILGSLFAAMVGMWWLGTLMYIAKQKVDNGVPLPKAIGKSIVQMTLSGPVIGMVASSVAAMSFVSISMPITILSLVVSSMTDISFVQVWFCGYALAATVGLATRPETIYDEAAAKQQAAPQGKTVAVVGGGMAGIVTAKECLQNGLDVVIFEKTTHLGGVWAAGGESKRAWSTIYSTSSTFNTQFSDFSMQDFLKAEKDISTGKKNYPDHFSRDEYMNYLDAYIRRFSVDKVAKMETDVLKIRRGEDGKGWTITSQTQGSDKIEQNQFDFIAICSGLAHRRKEIPLENQEEFVKQNGVSSIVHSEFYQGPEPFADKQTVVLGAGETSSDIAADICSAGGDVQMLERSPTLWLCRSMPELPPDFQESYYLFMMPRLFRVLRFSIPIYAIRLMTLIFGPPPETEGHIDTVNKQYIDLHIKEISFHPKSKGFGTSLAIGKQCQTTKSASLSKYVGNKCEIWPYDIKKLTKDGVVLTDPACTHIPCERIILAYGYQQTYDFLPREYHTCGNHDRYYYVFHPELQNIGWVGSVRGGIGSIPMGAEMQARWFALVAAGKRPLPSQAEMQRTVCEHKRAWVARGNFRWPTEVTSVYAKFLARHFVGCEPSMWEIFLRDPVVWFKVYSSTLSPSMFRFKGPYSMGDFAYNQYRNAKVDMRLGLPISLGFFSLISQPLWLCLRLLPKDPFHEWLPAFESYF